MTEADTTPLILQNIQDGIADLRDQLQAVNARLDANEARWRANDARWRANEARWQANEAERAAWRRRLDRNEARRDSNARQITELFDRLIDKARALDGRVTGLEQA